MVKLLKILIITYFLSGYSHSKQSEAETSFLSETFNGNIPKKQRLLLIGDSAIEGAGYDYEHTIGGLLQNYHMQKRIKFSSSVWYDWSPHVSTSNSALTLLSGGYLMCI